MRKIERIRPEFAHERTTRERPVRAGSLVLVGSWLLVIAAAPAPLAGHEIVQRSGHEISDASEALPTGSSSRRPVFLVTIQPGDALVSRFGHSALWIPDPRGGSADDVYGYGLLDTERPGFLRDLVLGRIRARMQVTNFERMVEKSVREGRSIRIQELELSSSQRSGLRAALERERGADTGDGAGVYRYDYFRTNCVTRIRDVLDRVLGGQIRRTTAGRTSPNTYRTHVRRLTSVDPLLYSGLALALGTWVDRPLSAWEEMFLPNNLRDRLRDIRVPDGSGAEIPLVRSERLVSGSGRAPVRTEPPRWLPAYLGVGLLLGGGMASLGRAAGAGANLRTERAFVAISAAWLSAVGALGVVLAALWGFTDQHLAYGNENLLQVHPMTLGVAALLVTAACGSERCLQAARRMGATVAGVATLGLLLKLGPEFHQANEPVLAMMIPAHVGLAWGLRLWKPQAGSGGSAGT